MDAPVSFNLQAAPVDATSWLDIARRAEADGFEMLLSADHPGATPAPFVALAAAAAVTESLRLGTYVVNLGVRDALHTAADIATLDVVSSGRAVFGAGAGHTPAEWSMIGRTRPGIAARVDHCIEAIVAVRALLAGETVNGAGLRDARMERPRAVQQPVPLIVGTANSRLLRWAAAHADVVGITGTGRTLADGHSHEVRWSREAVLAQTELIRDAAGAAGRRAGPRIDVLVQHVEIADDAERAAAALCAQDEGLVVADVLSCPYVLIGTAAEIAAEIRRHHDELGVTSFTVREPMLDAVAEIRAA